MRHPDNFADWLKSPEGQKALAQEKEDAMHAAWEAGFTAGDESGAYQAQIED
jgi:hypothetical protein